MGEKGRGGMKIFTYIEGGYENEFDRFLGGYENRYLKFYLSSTPL